MYFDEYQWILSMSKVVAWSTSEGSFYTITFFNIFHFVFFCVRRALSTAFRNTTARLLTPKIDKMAACLRKTMQLSLCNTLLLETFARVQEQKVRGLYSGIFKDYIVGF